MGEKSIQHTIKSLQMIQLDCILAEQRNVMIIKNNLHMCNILQITEFYRGIPLNHA